MAVGEGILPHEDGPIYYPCACIVSLQAPGELVFDRKGASGKSCFVPPLPDGSLLGLATPFLLAEMTMQLWLMHCYSSEHLKLTCRGHRESRICHPSALQLDKLLQ